ncbi:MULTISPECIES: peptidoglycan-binding domain-containing protein [Streptomyces]|uniref:Peptidoglycan-binding domain-containing protein n=1 Tax=Streptomyces doudnae TaxID=3075536 RepID=A0ABD5EK37_9ACTN|nr:MULTISPECIES: peptidoglycan-binding domain-containing protein [unclassified Streptomyces]MDT0435047.1 peptidoglycan-binding domain-containing protein [Streptomyces sp. DSM 41981]MYQ68737.1 peptidoglycan-binding protein [Streptomyces sp. SID4950]SCE48604.1 Putative peptidoglycan binding domain-containing protein [Streptomyces sp. SolWspMP-5a-2]
MALRVLPAAAGPTPGPATAPAPALTEETLTLGTLGPGRGAPFAGDVPGAAGSDPVRRRRRGRAVLFAAGGAVAVAAVASLAGGLLSYESPARDDSRADGVRAGVPAPATGSASVSPSAAAVSTRPAVVAPAPSASVVPSRSASPSAPSPTPSASASAEPSVTPSEPATVQESTEPTASAAPVLGRGDQGAEVTELQLRLRQLNLYVGAVDGTYGRRVEGAVRSYQWARGVQGDPSGVYGAATRERLEAETTQP